MLKHTSINAGLYISFLLVYSLVIHSVPTARAELVLASTASRLERTKRNNVSGDRVAAAANLPGPKAVPLPTQQPSSAQAAVISATSRDSFPNHSNGGKSVQGDTIMYSVAITNSGDVNATNVNFADTVDVNTSTLVPGSAAILFSLAGESYSALGNDRLNTANITPGSGQSVLENDTLNGATLTGFGNSMASANGTVPNGANTVTTANGGTVTMNADGSFKYDSGPGFTGADSFWYTVTRNGVGTGFPNGFPSGSAKVTVNVAGTIWFINSAAATGGNGTSAKPFNCYTGTSGAGQTCFSDTAVDHTGDNIFLFSGSYTGGNTLLNNQKLIGAGASDTLANISGVTVPAGSDALPATGGANPTITTTVAATNAINLGSGNTLRGFTVGNTTAAKIAGTSFGTLTVGNSTTPDVTLNGTGQALNLATGTFAATSKFSSVTSTSSADKAVSLSGVAGTVAFGSTTASSYTTQCLNVSSSTADINLGNVSCTGGIEGIQLNANSAGTRTFGTLSVSGCTGTAFIHSSGGGNATITGTTSLSTAGNAISVSAPVSGNTIDFQAATTATSTGNGPTAVNWSGTAGATMKFNSLSIVTNNGIGLNASGGGTINVTNATGAINNAAAQAQSAIVANGIALNANFSAIKSSGGTNCVALTSVTGTSNFGTGTLSGATGATFLVTGGSTSVTYSGNLTQATASQPLVSISSGHNTGTITFQTGTLSATNGTGLQFDNADGTYNFNGTNTLNGGDAGIDILNGSGGTFSFSSNTSITNPTGTCFTANGSTAGVTYSGNITKSGTSSGLLVDITNEASGTITFQTGTLSSTSSNGTGIQLSNADGTVNFNGTNTLNGGDSAIDLITGCAGTISFSSNTAVTSPSGIAYREDTSTANVTYNGTITQNNASNAISVNAKTGGTTTFNGGLTASTAGVNAITLTSNTGGTINFVGSVTTGGLNLSTSSGVAFNATGGGTISATQNNSTIINTLSATSGTALNVANTTIGASNLTFRSITSGSASNTSPTGIILDTTGSSGGLTISGNSSAGTGGTIQHKTGADGSTTQGIGIYLNGTSNVSLNWMQLNDLQNFGIRGTSVTGFTLNNSVLNSNAGALSWNGTNATGGVEESSISFDGLFGSATISNSTVSGGFTDNIRVVNTSGTLNRITMDNLTLGAVSNGAAVDGTQDLGDDSVHLEASGSAILNVTFQNSTQTSARGDLFNLNNNGTGTVDLIFNNNHLSNNYIRPATGGANMSIGTNGTGNFTYSITSSTFRDSLGIALLLVHASAGNASFIGTMSGNTIGVNGIANSGSKEGDAIKLQLVGAVGAPGGTFKTTITGNTIQQYNNLGIDMLLGGGAPGIHQGTYEAIITGNNVGPLGTNTAAAQSQGIGLNGGTNVGDIFSIYLELGGSAAGDKNTVHNDATLGDIRIRQRQSTTVHLTAKNGAGTIDYAGGATDTTAVANFIIANNTATNSVTATASGSGGGFVGGAPPLMLAPGGVDAPYLPSINSLRPLLDPTSLNFDLMSAAVNSASAPSLTQQQLNRIVSAAMDRWSSTGLTQEQNTIMRALKFELADLNGEDLGQADGNAIRIDRSARGKGWFVDVTPTDDCEFDSMASATRRYTDPNAAAAGHVDLLTALEHEIGHKLGLGDLYSANDRDNIMYGYLSVGERRSPANGQAQSAKLTAIERVHHLTLADDKRRDTKPANLQVDTEIRSQRLEVTNASNDADKHTSIQEKKRLRPDSGGTVNLAVGTITPGSTVVLTFQVTVNNAAPLGANSISNQGSVSGTGFSTVQTDDPDTGPANDATVTPILHPSAATGSITGRIVSDNGTPVEGAVVRVNGDATRKTITDANGNYRFDDVDTGGFYTVTPSRVNYSFNPFNRSFTQVGNSTEAAFTGTMQGDRENPVDTAEYFVRQQYVDVLGREPDEAGFNYWSDQILNCGDDAACIRSQRVAVAAAFFIEREYQDTGSFLYDLYTGALGRQLNYAEYTSDRQQVVGGATLEAEKTNFATGFVQRAEFLAKYDPGLSADAFVDALIGNVRGAGIDLSSERGSLLNAYQSGGDAIQNRAAVVKLLADNATLKQANYNAAFVLTEYFAYLHRNADQGGYDFWLNVIGNREVGNYRGMVCAFITSTEYQQRFSGVVSHSNADCGR